MNGNVWFALDEHLQIVRELCKFLHVAIHILQSWHLMKEYFFKIWTQYIILHSVMKPCFNVQSHQCADFSKWLPVICKLLVGFAEELKGGWIDIWSVWLDCGVNQIEIWPRNYLLNVQIWPDHGKHFLKNKSPEPCLFGNFIFAFKKQIKAVIRICQFKPPGAIVSEHKTKLEQFSWLFINRW